MKILIVGGGTAGWMTASYLKKALPRTDVTLVQSANIPTVGVGEATFSTLKLFFDFLGLQEADWMPACNATYKMAIRFQNWTHKKDHFYHPFERYETVHGFNMGEWWLKLGNERTPFDQACFMVSNLCEHNRAPKFLDGRVYDKRIADMFHKEFETKNKVIRNHEMQNPYGYHFDAALLARFLTGYAKELGAKEVIDDVEEVVLKKDGSISQVKTRANGALKADLFIDCTGFRGLLINKALKEPFLEFKTDLPNNSAVAIQVPRANQEEIRPYTTATAMNAGWAWTIPLYNRNGSGYVYCSDYLSKDEAEAEHRKFLGPASEGCSANHIQMRVGRNRNSWVKNCVSVGLAGGFVEPLESTGIFFIQHAIEELVNHFPNDMAIDEGQRLDFNRTVNNCFDGVCEFLSLHFSAAERNDTPYWRDMKANKKSQELEERLQIWRSRLPSERNIFQPFHGFESYSYSVMLMGLGYRPKTHLAALDQIDPTLAKATFKMIRETSAKLVKELPGHFEYLTHMRANAAKTGFKKAA